MLDRGVQYRFGGHHVVYHVAFTDLLVVEPLGGAQAEALAAPQEAEAGN